MVPRKMDHSALDVDNLGTYNAFIIGQPFGASEKQVDAPRVPGQRVIVDARAYCLM